MVIFFERRGEFVRCEAHDPQRGVWELTVVDAAGTERVEQFSTPEALDERLRELEQELTRAGWFGPYGRRA